MKADSICYTAAVWVWQCEELPRGIPQVRGWRSKIKRLLVAAAEINLVWIQSAFIVWELIKSLERSSWSCRKQTNGRIPLSNPQGCPEYHFWGFETIVWKYSKQGGEGKHKLSKWLSLFTYALCCWHNCKSVRDKKRREDISSRSCLQSLKRHVPGTEGLSVHHRPVLRRPQLCWRIRNAPLLALCAWLLRLL